MNNVYVSPVCHLVEVAAQMSICQTVSPAMDTPILSPTEGHGGLGPAV